MLCSYTLSDRCVRALRRIFYLFDFNLDGIFIDRDLYEYQTRSFGAELLQSEIDQITTIFPKQYHWINLYVTNHFYHSFNFIYKINTTNLGLDQCSKQQSHTCIGDGNANTLKPPGWPTFSQVSMLALLQQPSPILQHTRIIRMLCRTSIDQGHSIGYTKLKQQWHVKA
jgi:hypothetical protein